MSNEVCRERILSEDYKDFIVSSLQEDVFTERFQGEVCRQESTNFYQMFYVNSDAADPIRFDRYPYNSVPKCYTLIDFA